MHKYSFMTSKCPFLHQDEKLTSQKLTSKSMMTILTMTTMILTIDDDHNKVKLTVQQSTVHAPHPYYDICHLTFVIYRRLTFLSVI